MVVSFSTAIESVELIQESSPVHLRIGTVRLRQGNRRSQAKRVKIDRSKVCKARTEVPKV